MPTKKKFIDKKKATIVKLLESPIDSSDPDRRQFQVIKNPRADESDPKTVYLADLIQKKLNEGDYTTHDYEKQKRQKHIKQENVMDWKTDVLSKVKGKNDLWINHLHKQKQNQNQQQKQQQNNEEDDYEIEIEEEYDENDGDYDAEEGYLWEDINEEEEEDDDQFKNVQKVTKKRQEDDREYPDYSNVKFNPSIKQKLYDENGFPLNSKFDYSKYIAKDTKNKEGELLFDFNIEMKDFPRETKDIDYEPEEMTAEQKEVFEALECDGQNYEELEDNFIELATGGEQCIIENKKPDQKQQEKKIEIKQQKQEQKIDIKQQPQKQKQKLQQEEEEYEEIDDEDWDEDELEIDSQAEEEFKQQMIQYEEEEERENKQYMTTNEKQLNDILDEHIQLINKKKKVQFKEKDEIQKNNIDHEKEILEEEKKERELYELKKRDYMAYLKKKYPNTDPSEFHLPKQVEQLTLEQDIALQNYIKRCEEEKEELEEISEEEQEEEVLPENIITREMTQSQISRMDPTKLNIIRYEGKQETNKESKNKKKKKYTTKQIRDINEQIKIKEQQIDPQQLVVQKNETKEEKQERKKQLKELKKEKKEKKREFKQNLQTISKNHITQVQSNRAVNNYQGVSVIKIA